MSGAKVRPRTYNGSGSSTRRSAAPNGLSFALSTSLGHFVLRTTPVKTGEMYGVGVFSVNAGTTLSLVNSTGYNVAYAIGPGNASMTIVESPMAVTGATFSPTLSVSEFDATTFVSLAAGDTLELQLFGLLGAAILETGNGAYMTAIRLS